ncbi:MAG TPA: erythromycin esterase family protein [Candidatus Elarobacter sp.]
MDRNAQALREAARPLEALFELIGEAKVVLVGEASHGTHDFYDLRARLTERLIAERGFTGVAIEGDLPDTAALHRYVTGATNGGVDRALEGFRRFPTWMWRNTVVRGFAERLRARNAELPPERRAGIFGLDLYSLHQSMEAVVAYLERVDPPNAAAVRERYACFDRFGGDPQRYGYATEFSPNQNCRAAVREALQTIAERMGSYATRDGVAAADEAFLTEANARVAADAETYYRTMFAWDESAWNVRDRHMDDTLCRVRDHLRATHGDDKVVVWAHNSHLGDARATQMGRGGEVNLGQLARERFGAEVLNIGLFTYDGSVIAADDWGEPHRRMAVNPALPSSYEALFHGLGGGDMLLDLRDRRTASALGGERLERAIGVIYRPDTELRSHYFTADLARQFDLAVHLDRTRALEPLDSVEPPAPDREAPETYPSGV